MCNQSRISRNYSFNDGSYTVCLFGFRRFEIGDLLMSFVVSVDFAVNKRNWFLFGALNAKLGMARAIHGTGN